MLNEINKIHLAFNELNVQIVIKNKVENCEQYRSHLLVSTFVVVATKFIKLSTKRCNQ